ncbi:MAG: neutral/alkaline non-lysosomal ceramidase N-terminal domain-containing protein [Thermofilaceae archaeon]
MDRLKVGVAERVITPPVGVPMGGYALRPGPARGVHDNLHARALVLELGDNLAALVSLELLYPTPELVAEVRRIVRRELGIPEDRVMVSAVHTHSGPSALGIDSEPERSYLEEYWELLPAVVASEVLEARERTLEATVRLGKGRLDGWTVNRRKPLAGPLDNEVLAVLFEGSHGPIAAIVNFACHAVVLGHNNLLISADYPGAAARVFERLTGAKTLFLNGACGDVNPLTPGTALERVYDRSVGTFRDVEEMGTAVACEAVKSLMGRKPREASTIAAARSPIELETLELPVVAGEDVARLEEVLRRAIAAGEPVEPLRWKLALSRWIAEVSARVRARAVDGRIVTEVMALRVGEAVIVGLPGEPFVEVGMLIKKASPAEFTAVAGYTNDPVGYIPTSQAYEEGGYEVEAPACIVARGSAEKLAEEAVALLHRLYSGGVK